MSLAVIDDRPLERPTWVELMRPAAELATSVAATEFVPGEMRNRPDVIAAAILFGAELGIGPMVSLAKIAVVKGRPAPSAELGRALALGAGHEIWVEDTTNTRVTIAGKRRNSSHVFKVTWTMDDARRAGLASNPAYTKYPRQMLLARASAELVRQMCPDVLGGITLFAEEAADLPDNDAPNPFSPAATTITAAPAAGETVKRQRAPVRKAKQTPPDPVPEAVDNAPTPEASDTPPDGPSDDDETESAGGPTAAQLKLIHTAFSEAGYDERGDRLAAVAALVGHPVESSKAITRDEASQVIAGLEKIRTGEYSFTVDLEGNWHIDIHGDLPEDAT